MASATPARPASSPAPPVAAASLRSVWRSIRRSCVSSPSIRSGSLLVAGWADHEHHLGRLAARVRDAVWSRAFVVDAVACRELVDIGAELYVHLALDHEQELFGVTVCVRLVARRARSEER